MAETRSTLTRRSRRRSDTDTATPMAKLNRAQSAMNRSSAPMRTNSAISAVVAVTAAMETTRVRLGSKRCTRGPPRSDGAMMRARMTDPARGEVSPKHCWAMGAENDW